MFKTLRWSKIWLFNIQLQLCLEPPYSTHNIYIYGNASFPTNTQKSSKSHQFNQKHPKISVKKPCGNVPFPFLNLRPFEPNPSPWFGLTKKDAFERRSVAGHGKGRSVGDVGFRAHLCDGKPRQTKHDDRWKTQPWMSSVASYRFRGFSNDRKIRFVFLGERLWVDRPVIQLKMVLFEGS